MTETGDEGFSLVEMLVAMAIFALATAALLATPFGGKRDSSPELVARQIAAKLNLVAATAVASGRTEIVEIDVNRRTISVDGSSPMPIPEDFTMSLRTGLKLMASEEKGSLLFLADGTSSGGEIRLAAPTGRPFLIRINWVTGAINIARTD